MKSLKVIQILFKIARVLCLVFFGLCIAGVVFTTLGLAIFESIRNIEVGGKSITSLIIEKGYSINAIYVYFAMGLVSSAANGFMCLYISRYCKDVIGDGTPFTRVSVKKMRKISLVGIIVSASAWALCLLAIIIAKALDKNIGTLTYNNYVSLGFAVSLLVLSVFVEYPVEKDEQTVLEVKEKEETLNPEDYAD